MSTKKKFIVAIALAVGLSGTAAATTSFLAQVEYGIRYITGAAPPSNCTPGRVCQWAQTSDGLPYWRKSDGTDVAMTGGGGGGSVSITSGGGLTMSPSPLTGTGTIAIDSTVATLTGTQTLTNKTLTAPALGGTVTGTYTLGGTPTLTAPLVTGLLTSTTNAVASAQTIGALLQNTTASTSGAPRQDSPALALFGTAWNGSTSVTDGWHAQVQTNQSELVLSTDVAGSIVRAFVFNVTNFGYGIYSGNATNGISFGTSAANGTYLQYLSISPTAVTWYGPLLAMVDNSFAIGGIGAAPSVVVTHNTAILPQNVTGATSTTINPALGGVAYLNLVSATNVTSLTVSAGSFDGQELTVFAVEPATGTAATVPATWTGASFAGTYTPTSTLGKHDCFTFTWNATAAKWWERSRAIGASN